MDYDSALEYLEEKDALVEFFDSLSDYDRQLIIKAGIEAYEYREEVCAFADEMKVEEV